MCEKLREGLFVWKERESECASYRNCVEREGGKCKPVTASLLLTAPGLRDSSSPRFPCCRFNSIPSAQSSFFFLLFLQLATTLLLALHSSLSVWQHKRIHLLKTWGCLKLQGKHLQRTVVETAISTGTWSFFVLL